MHCSTLKILVREMEECLLAKRCQISLKTGTPTYTSISQFFISAMQAKVESFKTVQNFHLFYFFSLCVRPFVILIIFLCPPLSVPAKTRKVCTLLT